MRQLDVLKIDKVASGASSAGTAVNGSGLDMAGHESVIFTARIATANAGNYLKAQESDDNSSFSDLEGSKVVAGSNDDIVMLEVFKPKKRYIRAVLIRAGADTVTGDVYAIRSGGRVQGETNTNVTVSLEGPDAGTP